MHVDLPLSPLPGRLRVWLFKDVENIKQLRDSIIGKTADDSKGDETEIETLPLLAFPDASFLDASLIPDLWTLRLAAYAAEASRRRGRARARSRHTELVVALSGGKNISAALSTFGLSDGARHLLVARFVDDDENEGNGETSSDGDAFAAAVKGKRVSASEVERELASVSDSAAQARAYKIASWGSAAGGGAGAGVARGSRASGHSSPSSTVIVEVGPLSDAVSCRIALRDC